MKNNYWKLTQTIHVPDGLNDRVLFEARRHADEDAPPARKNRKSARLMQGLVCAVCALALLLGGLHFRPVSAPSESSMPDDAADGNPTMILTPTFGLTAYAAGTGTTTPASPDGGIAFAAGEGVYDLKMGDFTGCLFQITGENIASVRLSIDRGGLYRYQLRDNLTDEQINAYRQAMDEGTLPVTAISQRDDGTWYMPEMTRLGEEVQEDYDPNAYYGFWLSTEDSATNTGLGITIEAQMGVDFFDGAALTITAVSPDGSESTQVYRLHSGALKVDMLEENYLTVYPELAGPDEPFVYGIYALPED